MNRVKIAGLLGCVILALGLGNVTSSVAGGSCQTGMVKGVAFNDCLADRCGSVVSVTVDILSKGGVKGIAVCQWGNGSAACKVYAETPPAQCSSYGSTAGGTLLCKYDASFYGTYFLPDDFVVTCATG